MSANSTTTQPPLDYTDRRPALIAAGVITSTIATTVVSLRFWSKRLMRQSPGLDDWLCLAGLFSHHLFLAAGSVAVLRGGLGRDMRVMVIESPESVVILGLSNYIAEVAYAYSSPLIKLSVLAFYWHIFPTWTVCLGCKILASISIAWFIESNIISFVQCIPLEAVWHTELQALPTTKCLDWLLFYLGNSIVNCIIDFLTLALPVYEVMKLHTSRAQKIKICCVFLLGGITCVASVIRAVTLGDFYRREVTNFTKQFVVFAFATMAEIYVAIIGACLPMLVPVYRQLRYKNPHRSYRVRLSRDLQVEADHSGNKPLNGSASLERT